MGQPRKKCDVLTVGFEGFGGLVEYEILSFALWKPMPVCMVRILFRWQGDPVGEKHTGQTLGTYMVTVGFRSRRH